MPIFGKLNVWELKKKRDVNGLIKVLSAKIRSYPHRNDDLKDHEHAAEALGEIGDVRAVIPLINTFKEKDTSRIGDSYRFVHLAAARALGEIEDSRAVTSLANVIADDRNYDVRAAAFDSLLKFDKTQITEELLAAVKQETKRDIDYAGRYLDSLMEMEFDKTQVVEPLIAALKNGNYYARKEALKHLVKIKDRRVVEGLIVALKAPESDIRELAQQTLIEIPDSRAVEPLIGAIDVLKKKGYGGREISNIAKALAKIGDERAVAPLVNLIKEAFHYDKIADALVEFAQPAAEQLVSILIGSAEGRRNEEIELASSFQATSNYGIEFTLERILQRAATSLSEDTLRMLTQVKDITVRFRVPAHEESRGTGEYVYSDNVGDGEVFERYFVEAKDYTKTLDCSSLRQLAQQELNRRGIEPKI